MSGRTGVFAPVAIMAALCLGLAAGGVLPSHAQAQSTDPSTGVSPGAQIQNQSLPPPPGTNETNVLGPDTTGSAAASAAAPLVPEPSSSAAAPSVAAPTQWVPQQQAQLTVLDKIYGSASTVSATVGAPFAVRFLTVTVLACWVRPPTLPPDTAAFLQVTDTHAAPGSSPEFRGWIFKSEPALSGMNDPATDISVDKCG